MLNRSCVVPTVRHNDTGATRSSADPCAAARFAAPRGRACARARRREEEVMPRTARSLPAPCARPPSTRRAGHAHGVTGASWTTKHSQTWSPTHGSPTHKRDFLKLYLMKSEICAFKSLLGFLLRRVYILASGITKNRDFPDFIDLRKCASLCQSCELSAQIFHDGRLRS